MQKKLNFVFWGTPDVASETLEILKTSGYLPTLIITSPDKPQGRKMSITPPPVKTWAIKNNIPYIQPEKNTELLEILSSRGSHSKGEGRSDEKLQEVQYDLSIVVAYGKIIPENILNLPKLGSINVHYSLLPKYRGASPVESAILNGDTKTGVSIQKMVHKMDAGDLIALKETEIGLNETAPELRSRLIKLGGELLVKTLPDFIENKLTSTPQNETLATHCTKIKKEDGEINLANDAIKNYNKYKAYFHWPRTFFFKDGKRIIITKAKLENNQFIIEKIIPEGGKKIDYRN